MYHEIQAEDETHSKKSASTGSSSAIKSRSRVKSMSKHDQFLRLTHFLFAIKSGLDVKSGWRLDILFTFVLLFIVLETDFLLYVLSPAWISWYIFSTLFTYFWPIKSTLYSVFYWRDITVQVYKPSLVNSDLKLFLKKNAPQNHLDWFSIRKGEDKFQCNICLCTKVDSKI